jgi:hypothetical protein
MQFLVDHFRDGGWGMFPTVFFGLVLLGVAARYAVSPERRFLPLLIGLGTLTLAVGALGFVTGLIETCHYVGVDAERLRNSTTLAIMGFGESLNNVAFALVFIVLAALGASYGAFRLSKPPGDRQAAPSGV